MYFGIMFILYMLGLLISSFIVFIPGEYQLFVPYYFRFLAWMVGALMSFIGIIILWGRCKRVGANHLINPGRPGTVIWFYVYGDGECRILPCKRAGESQLYSEDLDAQIIDVKTYSLCDHKIRIVPEVVGHAVDLDYAAYVDVVKNKYGFENLREMREGSWLKKKKEVMDKEQFLIGDKNESLSEKIRRSTGNPKQST